LPTMEALASRCIPIITNYSAVTDFCTDENSLLLKDFLLMRGEFDINRALVRPECMMAAFQESYRLWKNDKDKLKSLADNGQAVAASYSWDKSAVEFLALIEKTHTDKVKGILALPQVIRI